MTATVYLSVADGELRAEDEGGKVRVVVGNFAWTFVLEDRLDCARWAKVIADADALFIRRKAANDDGHMRFPAADDEGNSPAEARQPEDADPRCAVDWGNAAPSQRCTRENGHHGVHVDEEGREFGYVPGDDDDPWGEADDDDTRAHVMSSSPGRDDDLEPLPLLPQRKPAGEPCQACNHPRNIHEADGCLLEGCECQRPDGNTPVWQAAMDAELSPEALAGGVPLETLAPEPQEDEAEA